MKKAVVLSSIIFLFACSPKVVKVVQDLSESDANRMSAKFPGITLSDLQNGKALHEEYCGKCHSLHRGNELSEEELNKVVPRMAKKSQIDEQKKDMILKYMITMNTRPLSK